MELSTVVFLSLVLCGMGDVHTGDSLESLTIRVEVVEQDLSFWKFSNTKSVTKLTKKFKVWKESLKKELTSTILPSLLKPLVEKEITNILTEDDIGHRITGQVRDEVHTLKDNVQYIKTQLRAITRDLRHVERERDTYRKSVRKERRELTKDIRAQVNQTVLRATSCARMLTSLLSQTISDQFDTNQTLAGLTQDFRTLNTSYVVTEKEIKSYREGLQEMKRNVSSDIQSLNIQLNQSIGDQFYINQTLAGLTQHFRTLNTSFVVTEREIKSYREGLQEMRRNVSSDIQSLNIQLNQSISDLFDTNQTLDGLSQDFTTLNTSCCGMRKEIKELSTTTYPGTTVSTTDTSENLTPTKTVPPAPVTTQDSDTHATPSAAASRDLYDASRRGDLRTVKRILAEGDVDINYRGQYSKTPVMEAAYYRHRDVVEFLVGRGADVSLVDSDGDNFLHWACRGGDLETVKLILSMNVVDINSRGQYSMTPVMMAARYGHGDVLKFLVDRGADVSLVDKWGNNFLHWACYRGDLETVILSMNVVDINSRGDYSKTPVMEAAREGHRDVVEFLVGRGADVSLVDRRGDNFLHYACIGGDLETVKLILDLNLVDINDRNNDGKTAADVARGRHQRVVDLLVSRGAH
ncbi:uncharacterized protein [Haliotis asinina]|uniref:uncharacterized protein n=1 Tax=Haliotis asinina TaxID=109174 RepID=UPI0035325B22